MSVDFLIGFPMSPVLTIVAEGLVVNSYTSPLPCATPFDATAWYQYLVLGVRPSMFASNSPVVKVCGGVVVSRLVGLLSL